jgi:cytoskeletal protein RodZ
VSTVLEPDTNEHAAIEPEEAQPPAAAEPLACPNCGSPAQAGQLMCLECGARLALGYQRAPSWRLPAAIVGVVVLLAGIGVAIALAAVTSDAGKTTAAAPTQSVPSTAAPADTAPGSSQTTPAPAPQSTAATTTPAPAATATTPAAAAAATGWPPGKSAFTVILASMPTKAAAEDKLAKANAAGITTAAILHSDDFPTLRPGYWVVFDGQYDTTEQANAQAAADRGKGEFTDAYARFVSKDQSAAP